MATTSTTAKRRGTGRATLKSNSTRSPRSKRLRSFVLPEGAVDTEVEVDGKAVKLTNLQKPFWPDRVYVRIAAVI